MDKWSRFNESILPDITKFYSKLNQQEITKHDHKHAQLVWDTYF